MLHSHPPLSSLLIAHVGIGNVEPHSRHGARPFVDAASSSKLVGILGALFAVQCKMSLLTPWRELPDVSKAILSIARASTPRRDASVCWLSKVFQVRFDRHRGIRGIARWITGTSSVGAWCASMTESMWLWAGGIGGPKMHVGVPLIRGHGASTASIAMVTILTVIVVVIALVPDFTCAETHGDTTNAAHQIRWRVSGRRHLSSVNLCSHIAPHGP